MHAVGCCTAQGFASPPHRVIRVRHVLDARAPSTPWHEPGNQQVVEGGGGAAAAAESPPGGAEQREPRDGLAWNLRISTFRSCSSSKGTASHGISPKYSCGDNDARQIPRAASHRPRRRGERGRSRAMGSATQLRRRRRRHPPQTAPCSCPWRQTPPRKPCSPPSGSRTCASAKV